MSGRRSLLEEVRGLLERTYHIDSGLRDLGPFVIGDCGYRLLYATRPQQSSVGALAASARTLVRESDSVVHARIYFPDTMIRRLEAAPPQAGVTGENVDAFATFVEEIDHLLLIAERTRRDRPVSLFELELHANVSKYLVLARFAAGRVGDRPVERRRWLRERLFDGGELGAGEGPAVQVRYRDAARYAVRLLDKLGLLAPAERLAVLRRFHTAGCRGKLELIEAES